MLPEKVASLPCTLSPVRSDLSDHEYMRHFLWNSERDIGSQKLI
jgi:hypothetical protein